MRLKKGSKDWDRFWSRVKKGPGCWEWTGGKTNEYGAMLLSDPPVVRAAHRLVWIMGHGEIPKRMEVCHTCDNPPCVRPSHLFLGTHAANMCDAKNKGRIRRGERAARSKLTKQQVKLILKDEHPTKEIAQTYNVTRQTIEAIKKRKTWKHVK